MAPTRGKNRRSIRANLRQISRAITFEPRRVTNLPVDPPPVRTSFHYTNVLEFHVRLAKESKVQPGFIDIGYTKGTTTILPWMDITIADLYLAWYKFLQFEPDNNGLDTEIAILRVCYWGPSRTEATGLPIGLAMDVNSPASSISLKDSGTTNARARVGVTVPQQVWHETTGDKSKIGMIRIVPDPDGVFVKAAAALVNTKDVATDGLIIGTVHVTVAVRRTRTF